MWTRTSFLGFLGGVVRETPAVLARWPRPVTPGVGLGALAWPSAFWAAGTAAPGEHKDHGPSCRRPAWSRPRTRAGRHGPSSCSRRTANPPSLVPGRPQGSRGVWGSPLVTAESRPQEPKGPGNEPWHRGCARQHRLPAGAPVALLPPRRCHPLRKALTIHWAIPKPPRSSSPLTPPNSHRSAPQSPCARPLPQGPLGRLRRSERRAGLRESRLRSPEERPQLRGEQRGRQRPLPAPVGEGAGGGEDAEGQPVGDACAGSGLQAC